MTFSFFHLPREVRDRIYHNVGILGTFPLERDQCDNDESIKASINIKPSTLHLLVNKKFMNEYVAIVFSGATLVLGPISSVHPQKAPVLPSLILANVTTCKIDLFVPYEAHKRQKEAQMNTICDPDVFLDLPFGEGERLDDFSDLEDEVLEESEDIKDLSDSEIEWEDAAEEMSFSDSDDEPEEVEQEQNTLAPNWLFHLFSQLRALESIELVVTSGEPMPESQTDGPADVLQLIAAEMQGLLQIPFLSKIEARRVVVEDYGFHDTKFAGVQRCGIWTAESGWKIPEDVGFVQGGGLELATNECTGWKCGDPTCLGAGNKHPYPRKWFKTPQEVEKEAGKR